ncbi:glutamate synthase large subunit [Alkalihalobacillus trypoxylicola]|uniref:Glutamate synthase subunit alpha n=1 Tax=Alkalihalobacillus trypoxylicola TaxID=519424 RepID=A0A161PD43_9BACI|nr:glutamate synthase large subunit [Alkalihalobacillus trypoxylicola]KYG25625.1 glutamate synthase subunit alpha [Alkalihalobacillus trypoxylicola]
MRNAGYPKKQGLYDPQFEHDNCGIGFLAHMKGKKSHQVIDDALHILRNLEHRGGQGDEVNTGDGAGILLQIPHRFFNKVNLADGIELPSEGEYGVGMLFLPQNEELRQKSESTLEKILVEEKVDLIRWRDVPTDDSMLGNAAKSAMPFIRQLFVKKPASLKDTQAFERKLYVVRKRAENEMNSFIPDNESFYFTSLSSRTIVYKGMLTTEQVNQFYLDIDDVDFESAIALVHSRFSTNTFPSWERAHPNRYMIHNGEINTVKGNVNWMHAREQQFESKLFGEDMEKIKPIIDQNGSDSSMFDNALEFLSLSGRSMQHTAMMMIPEPWQNDKKMSPEKKAFYQFHSTLMEPWDGPTAIVFTNGAQIGACLDRNGLRPSRYYVTKDDYIVMSSEVGVLDIAPENILYKERLHPGHMLLVDTEEGRIIPDEEIKSQISRENPYDNWVEEHLIHLDDVLETSNVENTDFSQLKERQLSYGYTYEELSKVITPMVRDGVDPVGSMGYDSPLAVLSKKPQLLYNYFKQLFAQVTNPPIDAIREEVVTAMGTTIGAEQNLLEPKPSSCRHIHLPYPIINNEELAKLRHNKMIGFKAKTLSILFKPEEEEHLDVALERLFNEADDAIKEGYSLLILSDRGIDSVNAPIPSLLAISGLHHHLIREGTRTKVSLLLESGEPREVHHHAVLLGYGAEAINPYLVFDSIDQLIQDGLIEDYSYIESVERYVKASTKGIMKVLSKMGISTIQSYRGAQIFEAVGISESVIGKYFTWTTSRIGGIDLSVIEKEVLTRHARAFSLQEGVDQTLDPGDDLQWRRNGEPHQYNPHTIHMLQNACRSNNYSLFKKYSSAINEQTKDQTTLRGLLKFKKRSSISIDEVEPASEIFKRFRTGAMSFGSISQEAHETLAIAMNRIGGKSNTGEGGEDPARFTPDENGDLRRSSIKQVASGRFGVTSHYLVNADEIQIKVAQGAKPGEGGQLPGNKVYPWVAEVRGSTPGVGLISPPPHHDIYSIEDLAELIHDLKNANPTAKVSVKLVAGTGVGTIAAGVAKGRADGIIISGYDGGTGAAARTSIKHTGLPWEIGLAETHQTLLLNNLRSRVTLETDGKLMTGKDVVVAALLGAEEFAFSTAPLVVLGCIIMRVCHLDTCPVGIATQNPELRKKYMGSPEHVVNFMTFMAEEIRELMAELGFKTFDEMIGQTDALEFNEDVENEKAKTVDLSNLLFKPLNSPKQPYCTVRQDHLLDQSLDERVLMEKSKPAIEKKEKVFIESEVKNTDRVVGTIVGSEVSKRYGAKGLPDDTINISLKGSAGQSLAAFLPKGISIQLEGDANDYAGKGLSGGKLVVFPPKQSSFKAEENILIGNTTFYGATAGEAYINGIAGERFAVRNSGASVVVEGVGDHGLEYMTGGVVVNLGTVGKNFAAGMSGGIAFVYDPKRNFEAKCNQEMVLLEKVESPEDRELLHTLISKHVSYTESSLGKQLLENWNELIESFVKVIPKDYKRMLEAINRVKQEGLPDVDAVMIAFDENKNDKSRVSGK